MRSFEISPPLPLGLQFNTVDGTISGSTATVVALRTYTIIGTDTDFEVGTYYVSIEVLSALTTCNYNVGTAVFVTNYPNYILPPVCDSNIVSCALTSGTLPAGISLNGTTGSISGVFEGTPSTAQQSITVTVTGANNVVVTVILNYISVDPSDSRLKDGLLARFSANQGAWSGYMSMWYRFETYIDFYTTKYDTPEYSCADGNACEGNGGRIINTFGKWTAAINFEQNGDYVIEYRSDDNCAIFIDDMNTIKGAPTTAWNVANTYTYTVTRPGYHAFGIIHHNGGGAGDLSIKWKKPGDSSFATIPMTYLRHLPTPVQRLVYVNNQQTFYTGGAVSLTPTINGYCQNPSSNPTLSTIGLSVGYLNARISGNAIYSGGNWGVYTITCINSVTEYSGSQAVVRIRVTNSAAENAVPGLIGKYYKSASVNCAWRDINSNDVLKYIRVDDTYGAFHSLGTGIWDGLSADFSQTYAVVLDGYVNIETAGDYTFYLTIEDAGRLAVTGRSGQWITLAGSCKSYTNQFTWTLSPGLVPITVYYYKGSTTLRKQLELSYSGPGIEKQLMPTSVLRHLPTSAFEFTYMQADYVAGVTITPNCPIFVTDSDRTTYTSFSESPSFQQGVIFNSDNCITGQTSGNYSSITYTISACNPSNPTDCLTTTISIESHAYLPPSNLNFNGPISTIIGTFVEARPTYITSTALTWTSTPALPQGLYFGEDGTILGNPVEVFDQTVLIKCSNPSGSSEFNLQISIRDCSAGSNFVYLQYITGDPDVSLNLVSSDGERVLMTASDHSKSSYYSFYSCSPKPQLRLEVNFEGERGGTYILGGKGNVIFRKGKWGDGAQSLAFQFSIESSDTPTFSYPQSTYSFAIGEEVRLYTNAIVGGAARFALEDDSTLPQGIFLNETSGEFYGYPISGAVSGTVVVRAYGITGSYGTASVAFNINPSCPSGKILFTVEFIMVNNGQRSWARLEGDSGNVFYYRQGFQNNFNYRWSQCIDIGEYTFYYGSIDGGNTDRYGLYKSNSLIRIINPTSYLTVSLPLSLLIVLDASTSWEYSQNFVTDWYKTTGSWQTTATTATLPSVSGITVYYRSSISLVGIDYASISRFELSLTFIDGIVVYLNGEELYRRNLPEGANQNEAGSSFASSQTRIVYGSNRYLKQDANIFGIEVHKNSSAFGIASFSAELTFTLNSNEKCTTIFPFTAITSSTSQYYTNSQQQFGNYYDEGGFGLSKDDDTSTKYKTTMYPVTMRYWIQNGAASTLDQYYIATAGDCIANDPNSWTIQGCRQFSNENEDTLTWVTLASVTQGTIPGTSTGQTPSAEDAATRKSYYYFEPTAASKYAYEAFRFIVNSPKFADNECGSAIQFSEFNFQLCKVATCTQDGLWPATLGGQTAELECDSGYVGSQTRVCSSTGEWQEPVDGCVKTIARTFNYPESVINVYVGQSINLIPYVDGAVEGYSVNPKLPTGITLDGITGVITGSTQEIISGTRYDIIATTEQSQLRAYITITTTSPKCPAFIDAETGENIPATNVGGVVSSRCHESSGTATYTCVLYTNGAMWTLKDTSKCIAALPPGCNDIGAITLKVNDPVSKIVTCTRPPSELIITPLLPNGISITRVGNQIIVSGTALTYLNPTTYIVNATYASGGNIGYDELRVPISIYDTITRCSYPYGNTQFPITKNVYIEILPPTCNTIAESYHLKSNNLPPGLTFDETTGTISGSPTTASGQVSIVMYAQNTAGVSPDYTLNIRVLEEAYDSGKLNVKVTPTNSFGYAPSIEDQKSGWASNSYSYVDAMMPVGLANNYAYTFTFPMADGSTIERTTSFLSYYSGYLYFPSSGIYEITLYGDDNLYVFIDDMQNQFAHADYYETKTITKRFETGYHPLEMYLDQQGGEMGIRMQWRCTECGMATLTTIADEYFCIASQGPVQRVTYSSNNLILVKGITMDTIAPTVVGYVSDWTISPDLPPGISFSRGVFSGTPLYAFNRETYTITATYKTSISVQITLGVLDNTAESLSSGLTGYYYSGNVACKLLDIDTVRRDLTLKFKRYETTGLQFRSSADVWPGLTNDFKNSFASYWIGYITFPENGDYTFSYSCQDWCRLHIGGEGSYFSNGGAGTCGTFDKTFTWHMSEGVTYFGVLFGKGANANNKTFTIQWSHTNGNYPFNMRDIEIDEFRHIPEGYLEYTYKKATYVSHVTIIDNSPIFFQLNKNLFTSFAITPLLPGGLILNPQTGTISGTPTDESVINTVYTVTASGTGQSPITTEIEFSVEQRLIPANLTYPAIRADIGSYLTDISGTRVNQVIPTLINSVGVVFSVSGDLPAGLTLDPNTGIITGTPTQEWNQKVVIIATNPSGTCETEWDIVVNGCGAGRVFIRMEYAIGNGATTMNVNDNNNMNILSGGGGSFSTGNANQKCTPAAVYNITFTRASAYTGGWFKFYVNNLIVSSGNCTDGLYTTDIFSANGVLNAAPPVVTYPSTEVHLIPGEKIDICPTVTNGATSFTLVSPTDMPLYSYFDPETGCITGTSLNFVYSPTFTVQVKAANQYGESNVVSIQFIGDNTCGNNQNLLVAVFDCDNECGNNYYTLKSISSSTNVINNGGNFWKTKWMSFCVKPGAFTLTIGNSLNHAWSSNTQLKFYLEGSLFGTYKHETVTRSTTLTVSLSSYVQENSNWYYSESAPTSDFWKSELDTTFLTKSGRPGTFPARFGVTTYYGINFNFYDDFSIVKNLEAAFSFDAGIAVYFNGKEIYRARLPSGYLQNSTFGTGYDSTVASRQVVIPQVLVKYGQNYLAVECHKHQNSKAYDPFKASILPVLATNNDRCVGVSYTPARGMYGWVTNNAKPWDDAEGVRCATDFDTSTKLYVQYTQQEFPVSLALYWPDYRAEFFNRYDFYTANDMFNYRNPTSWKLYGAYEHDSNSWELIDTQSNPALPSTAYTQKIFQLDNNYKAFNAFRLEIENVAAPEGNLKGYQLSELRAVYCRPSYCAEDGEWPTTAYRYTARILCNTTGTSGWVTRRCEYVDDNTATWGQVDSSGCRSHATSISYDSVSLYIGFTSSLNPRVNGGVNNYRLTCPNGFPNGLSFESETGIISGAVSDETEGTYTCTVTAETNSGNSPSTTVSINVQFAKCLPTNGYTEAVAGETKYRDCDAGYSGQASRTCSSTTIGQWENENLSGCKRLEPEFLYSGGGLTGSDFAATIGSMLMLTPVLTAGRVAEGYTFSGLPMGASGDGTAGSIMWQPTSVTSATVTVTATNSDSSYVLTVRLGAFATVGAIIYSGSPTYNVFLNIPIECSRFIPAPLVTGNPGTVTVTPPLPAGLQVSPVTGCVYGTPTTQSSSMYTVMSSGTQGTSQFTLNVGLASCPADGLYLGAVAGAYSTIQCDGIQVGNKTRYCPLQYNPVLEAEVNNCRDPNPTSFSYPNNNYINAYTNVPLSSVIPTVGGVASSVKFAVEGLLPYGLSLGTDGSISGTPTSPGQVSVRITASDTNTITVTLTIVVTTTYCEADPARGLARSVAGTVVRKSCPSGYNGDVLIVCSYSATPKWGEEDDSACYPPAPQRWGYGGNLISFSVNFYKSLAPVVEQGGIPTSYRLTRGALPEGLSLKTDTGEIFGMATSEFSSTPIRITGTNNLGSADAEFNIQVIIAVCPAQNGWPETPAGSKATKECTDSSLVGDISRICSNSESPVWENEVSNCRVAPPEFKYASKEFYIYYNIRVDVRPSVVQGNPTSFSISGNLIPGLTFDETSGAISGLVLSSYGYGSEVYYITATNAQGESAPVLVMLTVSSFSCSADGQWAETIYGNSAAVNCPDGYLGILKRPCNQHSVSSSNPIGVWGAVDNSSCVLESEKTTPPEGKVYLKFELTIPYISIPLSGTQYLALQDSVTRAINEGILVNNSAVRVQQDSILLEFTTSEASTTAVTATVRIADIQSNNREVGRYFNPNTDVITEKLNSIISNEYRDLFGSSRVTIDTGAEIEGPTTADNDDDEGGVNVGLIIGLSIVGAAILIIALGCIYCRCVARTVEKKTKKVAVKKPAQKDGKDGKATAAKDDKKKARV